MNNVGFVCEIQYSKIRVFTKAYKLIELPFLPRVSVRLGDWLEIFNKNSYNSSYSILPYFNVWSEDDDVFIQLLITGPNLSALSKAVFDKYQGLVWSPHLQLIRDPNSVYHRNFQSDEVGEVVVKYAPSSDGKFFEVIRAVQWLDKEPEETKKGYWRMAPWIMEKLEDVAPIYELCPEELISTNRVKKALFETHTTGICIHHEFKNPFFNKNIKGSQRMIALLWSPLTGLTQWKIYNQELYETPQVFGSGKSKKLSMNPLLQLGEWFTYNLNDNRVRRTKTRHCEFLLQQLGDPLVQDGRRATFKTAYATKVFHIDHVKPTKRIEIGRCRYGEEVKENTIEIECSFQFQHSLLEDEANRSVKDWATRERGLRVDAHFNDFDLGKIEIYPQVARLIIEKIENFREELKKSSPEEYQLRQKDMIVVRGAVHLLDNFFANSKRFPDCGLFFLKAVYTIAYHRDGKVIYQNPEEKNDMEVLKDLSKIQVKF
uniref:AAA domain-containing protein n=1 Tax=Caenorhabditis tropicalis TaxID=1561998 RepID=A0A1I7TBT3_9PELO